MGQPLAKSEDPAASSIEAAAVRLEQAFRRLETAVDRASSSHHSLRVDHEKLNLLLRAADEKITELRETTETVSKRLDRTISMLEGLDG